MPTLNIGILAHVDAGKTSLTERLLFDTGAIDRLGSVDAGDTQTDSNEIERRRGITIRSAVAPFRIGDLQVNLIDTPGHPDFIAEVERALSVLDGAVLVLSAVEGVQAQTRVLMRTLRQLRLPTLVFANKVDRMGARDESLLSDVRRKLSLPVVPMNSVQRIGTRTAHAAPPSPDDAAHRARLTEILAENDDSLLEALVADDLPAYDTLLRALAAQTAGGLLNPLYFGSALTGEGVATLLDGIGRFLPRARTDGDGLRGTVFAIERGRSGEKFAFLRMYAGELRERQRVTVHRPHPDGGVGEYAGQITFLRRVGAAPGDARHAGPGSIARIGGLPDVRVGDEFGSGAGLGRLGPQVRFAPPRLETLVHAGEPGQAGRLHAALVNLADQDPLIQTRTTPDGGTSVLLYGEVQKEVIAATLARDFGVEAIFEPSHTIHVERVTGVGAAFEPMGGGPGEFCATIGLRVEPAEPGAGVVYRMEVELGSLPLAYHRAIEETVRSALTQGRYGWSVPDCRVTLTHSGFSSAGSTAADFRHLTPLVLMRALDQAGTRVHEPLDAFELEVPADTLSAVTRQLTAAGAAIRDTAADQASWQLSGGIPARQVHAFQQQLPELTHGEGVWWSRPDGDRPAPEPAPRRARTDGNPFDRDEYLRHLTSGGSGG
ncbi:elongation factor G [Actinopolymorpha pittospori]|uniref:Ribosomal protection tetracycline resistance protein n=1 Tax=Actinopolymorpha pittospori TaxID=648752 RepID=A0A927REK4_9ACTN|nr:TetM/TetW/TetO/TetS family tetracycline resistance ribosomal protection protein [Actinopolymorpha pittospori]MBE1612274.1 ribosomal protection tetracycline resistance protein [Actinopolymorpha pittospori]